MSAASVGSGYVPPFASIATSARTAITATASVARPSATGSTSAIPTTVFRDSSASLLYYFTIPYLDAHVLSPPTYRYAYYLYFVIAAVFLLCIFATQFNERVTGGGIVGAWLRKMSIRRITLGGSKPGAALGKSGKRRKGWASPTIAQMMGLFLLLLLAALVSVLGPNYISPTTCLFGGECAFQSVQYTGPPRTTFGAKLKKRSPSVAFPTALPVPFSAFRPVTAPLQKRQNNLNNPNGYAPFNDPLLAGPNFDINANWWTAGSRLGLIAYALLPLCVTFALKQWPFNIFATPFLTSYHFDKTAILHRWSGRIIWLMSTAHVGAWSYQLVIDKDPFGRAVYVPVWEYWRFKAGATAYLFLTIMMLSSLRPVRKRYYEFFYWSHVVLVVGFLVSCILHYKPLLWWCAGSLILWGADRFTRTVILVHINGVGRKNGQVDDAGSRVEKIEKVDGYRESNTFYPPLPTKDFVERGGFAPRQDKRISYYDYGPGQDDRTTPFHRPSHSNASTATTTTDPFSHSMSRPGSLPAYVSNSPPHPRESTATPPPGFAFAQLLPGRTVRLTINTPKTVRWLPGQHIHLTIPSISRIQSHPYTILSVDDRAVGIAPLGLTSTRAEGSEIVLLVRAQKGFSKQLWDVVLQQRRKALESSVGESVPGVNLRAIVSWPVGSAARASWENYESFVIVCGGTGCTFGVTILEYVCRRMARRDALRKTGQLDRHPFKATRIRFVWILREYAHLAWIAPTLRRCLELLDPHQLQLDLYVTSPNVLQDLASTAPSRIDVRQAVETDVASTQLYRNIDDNFRTTADLVLFEGEEDTRIPIDHDLSKKLKEEGMLRRAKARASHGVGKSWTKSAQPRFKPSPASGMVRSESSEVFLGNRMEEEPESDLSTPQRPFFPHSDSSMGRSDVASYYAAAMGSTADLLPHENDQYSHSQSDMQFYADTASTRKLIHPDSSANSTIGKASGGMHDREEDVILDVSEQDQDDLNALSELARPGHARLDGVLDDELARSEGRMMVACCGPTSLNTIVRHLVAERIDLGKLARGDLTGDIALSVEDFSY